VPGLTFDVVKIGINLVKKFMESLIVVIHIVSAVAIIGLVLIQQGKGADMGASFGSGASQTIFGSAGTGNVLTKSTTWLAALFFVTSLTLAVVARNKADAGIDVESLLVNPDAAALVVPAGDQSLEVAPVAAAAGDIPVVDSAPSVEVPAEPAANAETAAPVETVVEPEAQTTEN